MYVSLTINMVLVSVGAMGRPIGINILLAMNLQVQSWSHDLMLLS